MLLERLREAEWLDEWQQTLLKTMTWSDLSAVRINLQRTKTQLEKQMYTATVDTSSLDDTIMTSSSLDAKPTMKPSSLDDTTMTSSSLDAKPTTKNFMMTEEWERKLEKLKTVNERLHSLEQAVAQYWDYRTFQENQSDVLLSFAQDSPETLYKIQLGILEEKDAILAELAAACPASNRDIVRDEMHAEITNERKSNLLKQEELHLRLSWLEKMVETENSLRQLAGRGPGGQTIRRERRKKQPTRTPWRAPGFVQTRAVNLPMAAAVIGLVMGCGITFVCLRFGHIAICPVTYMPIR
eukprot:gnl/TRDRNA2_/TRDRNA2_116456_c1_seq2.p1 gnl/TRDRNA2_/TRDRNA2_116456_c1~~gnl/TRDRNA2_/TRDRNA2_116456_c1_seq2.p1  ORF type:complete len:320 (+),score=51.79 gnl/TRDRNA2_/TRDRNA2_116456_c1_seq2:70-960(+)